MKYEDFVSNLKTKVQQQAGKSVRVELRRVTKNNGIEMDGLSIIEENRRISPMIYVGDYFKSYEEGASLAELAAEILKVYEKTKIHVPIDPEFYTDFEKVQDRIVCKLINYEKNRELLKRIPHLSCLDLAVVYYCMLDNPQLGNGMILIYNSHLEMWNVSKEEIFERGRNNTQKLLPYEFQGMGELLRDTLTEEELAFKEEAAQEQVPMFVLSNVKKYLGAACILYDSILAEIGERIQDDFFVLPSSVHEVIIVPASSGAGQEDLEAMVREINTTQVLPEEILSDRVYYYDRKSHRLSL